MRLFITHIVVLFGLLLTLGWAHSTQRNPLRSVALLGDAVLRTPANRVHALSSFHLTFTLSDRSPSIRLVLEPNHNVVPHGATVTYLAQDGSVQRTQAIDRLEHRVFKGAAFVKHPGESEWIQAGWARIHVHRDGQNPIFEGAFQLYGDQHHVQTRHNYYKTRLDADPHLDQHSDKSMVVWRDSDIISDLTHVSGQAGELRRDLATSQVCTAEQLSFNSDENHPLYRDAVDGASRRSLWAAMSPSSLFGRQIDGTTGGNSAGINLTAAIGSTSGCPTSGKVALIGIATDCTYTADFANDTAVRINIISQVNTASQLYESTFNISLGLQNLTISPSNCPSTASTEAPWNIGCSDSVTITDRLNLFSQWRGQNIDNNAYWTLLSTCSTQSAVGLAWLGQLCMSGSTTEGNETVAAANVVVRTSTEWQVFAHESGHTFGAVHDCTSETCVDGTATKQQCCPLSASTCNADGQFIMNPSTASGITQFSQCTLGNICSALGRQSVQSSCLSNNQNVPTITGSQCGNGIVETGEDCDCGGTAGCAGNTCCNGETCQFTTNSVCDPSNEDCCTSECQYASNGTVCRDSTGLCDPQEVCTGSTSTCPADGNAPDGTSCGSGLECASGQCTSRDDQCQSLMGSMTTNNDTTACGSSGCQISCQSPDFGTNICYQLNQNFLDGTPCGCGGGRCSNGQCEGSNTGDEIQCWIDENKNIVIPVACVVGALLLLSIACCVRTILRRRGRKRNQAAALNGGPKPRLGEARGRRVTKRSIPGGRSQVGTRSVPPPFTESGVPQPPSVASRYA
ncbi:Metallo-peptidase family M12-domain-containing protein [Coniella lustricola]|uniref:Disintegrin and metalloproteinase domain-containing protein B n=1 Tax=Coniella lustricola TaxID=2025994 RepID=A0A2T3ABP8_9PEZI|nr:Metallo-peptidase family M12-domain-containing protein [Coniella lustricola]